MTPSGICVVWSCPECGASGTIDPVNPPEVAISALRETHRLLSPQCSLAAPEAEREYDERRELDDTAPSMAPGYLPDDLCKCGHPAKVHCKDTPYLGPCEDPGCVQPATWGKCHFWERAVVDDGEAKELAATCGGLLEELP